MLVKRMSGDSVDCESICESGCETSCESFACESGEESGCSSNCEVAGIETVFPIKQVKVLSGVSSQYGSATVMEVDKDGNTFGDSFVVYDPFDCAVNTNDISTVYLNFNYQWVFVPSQRNVKYVKVNSDLGGGQYSVTEQDKDGTAWGDSFAAWAVDSV
jgi:hypothetical protein